MVAELGFEPRLEAPKAPVLPLHHSAMHAAMASAAAEELVPKAGIEPARPLRGNGF